MSINFYILTASKDLIAYEAELRSIAQLAKTEVEKLLPIKDVDIIFYDNPQGTIDEIGGIGGFTPNANTMFISLNPRHKNFKEALKEYLFYILAHELHHTIRWQKEVEGDSLLEALIFEGLADHFAMQVTKNKKPLPWSYALTPEQKDKIMKKASQEWNLPTYNNHMWFFGSDPTNIPRWAGYTLGYDIVGDYLKEHLEAKALELATADATLFI